jgi:hypothetical protein
MKPIQIMIMVLVCSIGNAGWLRASRSRAQNFFRPTDHSVTINIIPGASPAILNTDRFRGTLYCNAYHISYRQRGT